MIELRLYVLQRASALVMVPLVIGHLGMMIYAVQGGLSTAEILSRTQGSLFWLVYYGLFVLAASAHGAIGVRVILGETLNLNITLLNSLAWLLGLGSLWLGLGAVMAVTLQ